MIPQEALTVLTKLNNAGFEAYIVGGAVRDFLRGVPSDDCDITTNAAPQQIMDVFSDNKVIPTGLKHGTITVGVDNTMFEVTTYRTDGTYSDGRHPDFVAFTTSLEEDLARRDFTINAIAYHPEKGIVDPFGGERDIKTRRLRCVGDPNKRFTEDALRIARLLRFAAVLGFTVEEQTALAANTLCRRLSLVAAERKRVELVKMLAGQNFTSVAMQFHQPLCCIIPALSPLYGFDQQTPYHDFDIYEHTMRAVGSAPHDTITRLALLLHDIGKPSAFSLDENGIAHYYGHAEISERLAEGVMNDLRFDNATIKAVLPLIHYHMGELSAQKKAVRRRLQQMGEIGIRRLIDVKTADAGACKIGKPAPDFSEIIATLDEIILNNDCVKRSALAVNGHDLIERGFPSGPLIGEILDALLDDVMNERCDNKTAALLAQAERRWRS